MLTYYELANTLVHDDWRGFGLQYELILAGVASLIFQTADAQSVLTAVNPTNEPSLKNVKKAGFEPCDKYVPDLLWGCGSCPYQEDLPKARKCCCDCFILLKEQQRVLMREFLDRHHQVQLFNKYTNQSATLLIECAASY